MLSVEEDKPQENVLNNNYGDVKITVELADSIKHNISSRWMETMFKCNVTNHKSAVHLSSFLNYYVHNA